MKKEISILFSDLCEINGFVHIYKNVIYIVVNINIDTNLWLPILESLINNVLNEDIQDDFIF